jgi:hypothetical protein
VFIRKVSVFLHATFHTQTVIGKQNKMIRILLFFLISIQFISCQKTRYKSKLIQIYLEENQKNVQPISIEKITILESEIVGDKFKQNIEIDEYKHIIKLKTSQLIIMNRIDSMLELNISRYNKITLNRDSQKFQKGLSSSKTKLYNSKRERKSIQREINSLKEKINNIEINIDTVSKNEYLHLEYLLVASNDSIEVNDTLSILIFQNNYVFQKNKVITDYIGR